MRQTRGTTSPTEQDHRPMRRIAVEGRAKIQGNKLGTVSPRLDGRAASRAVVAVDALVQGRRNASEREPVCSTSSSTLSAQGASANFGRASRLRATTLGRAQHRLHNATAQRRIGLSSLQISDGSTRDLEDRAGPHEELAHLRGRSRAGSNASRATRTSHGGDGGSLAPLVEKCTAVLFPATTVSPSGQRLSRHAAGDEPERHKNHKEALRGIPYYRRTTNPACDFLLAGEFYAELGSGARVRALAR